MHNYLTPNSNCNDDTGCHEEFVIIALAEINSKEAITRKKQNHQGAFTRIAENDDQHSEGTTKRGD